MDTPEPHPDPCEVLNAAPPPGAPHFREALLLRTQGVLRRRRCLRRLGLTAALAACYAAGLLTFQFGIVQAPTVATSPGPPPATEGADRTAKETMPATEVAASTMALEWQALDGEARDAGVYRRLGDRYAEEEGDYPSALRCYRDALDTAPAADQAIAPGDSWLLMVLKDARKKEKQDAKVDR